MVPCLQIRDVDRPIDGVDGEVEQRSADVVVAPRSLSGNTRLAASISKTSWSGSENGTEPSYAVPVLVHPVASHRISGRAQCSAAPLRPRFAVGSGFRIDPFGRRANRRGLVPGAEDRDVDAAAVRRRRKSSRSVAEQGQYRLRLTTQAGAQRIGIEDPDVRPTHPLELVRRGIDRTVLPTMGRGDERASPTRAGEHDVPRLVTDQQGYGRHAPAPKRHRRC